MDFIRLFLVNTEVLGVLDEQQQTNFIYIKWRYKSVTNSMSSQHSAEAGKSQY